MMTMTLTNDNDIDTQKQRLHNLMKKYDWQSLS